MSAPEQGSAPVSDLRRDQERRAAWDGSPPRVLLVEDEEEVRVPLRELLEDMGIEVAGEAGDGEEAIELAGRLQPEVVLMDLRLPKMDGLSASRAIKDRHPRMQVIILSVYDDDQLRVGALDAGATLYLVKGCQPWLVEQAITSCANLARGVVSADGEAP